MCLSPVHIPNPNFGLDPRKYPLKNCTDNMIDVPCGYCSECIAVKQMYLVQRIQAESIKNHLFFCTLTYNNDSIPTLDVNGYKIRYCDITDIQNMMKRLRKNNVFGIPFRFFAVSELGSKRGRPHAHIIFMFEKKYFDKKNFLVDCEHFAKVHEFDVLNNWKRNIALKPNGKPDTFHPNYIDLCTFVRKTIRGRVKTNYHFHYVYPNFTSNGTDDVGFYVLKYMLKQSPRAVRLQQALRLNLPEDVYEKLWSKVKPRYFKSLGFGLCGIYNVRESNCSIDKDIYDKIKSDVRVSLAGKAKYPMFFKFDGTSWPLAPFYKNHWSNLVTTDDLLAFHKFSSTIDSSELHDHDSFSTITTKQIKFDEIKKQTDGGFDDDLDFLFE